MSAREPLRDPEGRELANIEQVVRFRDASVVEIGCGNGRLTWKYVGQARTVLAFDSDGASVVEALAARSAELRPKVMFVQAAAEALPARREAFDLAIFAWSL